MNMKIFGKDNLAILSFFLSASFLVFIFGYAVREYKIFPYSIILSAQQGLDELKLQFLRFSGLNNKQKQDLPWYYSGSTQNSQQSVYKHEEAYNGLNLITRVDKGLKLKAEIRTMEGKILHEWNIDWFDIWPDAKHLPEKKIPKNKPGTHLHGAVVLKTGDLVFNFEGLGLVRLARNGSVVWRLPYMTHHSVTLQENGNLLVCGSKLHEKSDKRFPYHQPPFVEDTILEVTPEGKISNEWSVIEILKENGLDGIVCINSIKNSSTKVKGDVFHLNDVEQFPVTMQEGFFKKGDILVSLRNVNTIFVFNRQTRKVGFVSSGWFVRQHDPDFVDGNRISVFDNNSIKQFKKRDHSRIVIIAGASNTADLYFKGNKSVPFFSKIMGKHQWLPNGNLLITESLKGRAIEITPKGEVVWDFVNIVDKGIIGLVEEVQRISEDYSKIFTAKNSQAEIKS